MASALVCGPTSPIIFSGTPAFDPQPDKFGEFNVEMTAPGTNSRQRSTRSGSRAPKSAAAVAAENHRPVTRSRSRKQARPSKSPVRASTGSRSGGLILPRISPRDVRGLVALITALAVISTFWRWHDHRQSPGGGLSLIPSAKEVAEMDAMLRKTTKWMQAQLDLIDMKIGQEMSGLKREVEQMMDAEAFALASKVHSLKSQMDSIETSLSFLKQEGLLTRQETLQLIGTASDERAVESSGKALSLDEIRVAAKRTIEEEFERHRADGIGRTDYALASGGGRVTDYSEAYFYQATGLSGFLLPGGYRRHPNANKILEPSFGEPGHCLPLKGSHVYVDIRLRTSIYADSITLEHVSKRVAYDLGSAPKEFRVFGWLETSRRRVGRGGGGGDKILLGEFRYEIDKGSVQTFKLQSLTLLNSVRVEVLSNYGSPTHTCLYRIRVHGSEPQALR